MEDPWDGSSAAKLDNILSTKLPATGPVTVHLGPAPATQPFLTGGYYEIAGSAGGGGWQLRAGLKIVGSGIDVTVLKLTGVTAGTGRHYFAAGHDLTVGGTSGGAANPADYSEIAELTIDCGLASASDNVACGAVRVLGNHVKIRQVKAINWGNRVSLKPGFVLAVLTSNPATSPPTTVVDAVIEECIVINPSVPTNGTLIKSEVLLLHAGGKDHDTTQLEAFGISPVIRACFVDAQDPTAPGSLGDGTDYRSKFRGISMASCSAGVVTQNIIQNCWYGGPFFTKWSARSVVVRNNSYRNVVSGPYASYPSSTIGSAITISAVIRADATSTLARATATNHKLTTGDRVLVANVTPSEFNGLFLVTTVSDANTFEYRMLTRPASDGSGASKQMQKVVGVEKLVIDGNVIELATSVTTETPVGLKFDAVSTAIVGPAYVYGDVVLQGNQVRYLDGSLDPLLTGYASDVKGHRNLQVARNTVEAIPANPLKSGAGGATVYGDNRTPAGSLIQGYGTVTQALFNELETDTDFAMLLGLFNDNP